MRKEKIFVSAYACEPYKGSEIGVGWNWVMQMSKHYELWVLTRANNREPIESYFSEYPEKDKGIHFVYYDLPDWIKKFKKQMRGIYLYYPLWVKGARSISNQIMKKNNIHIYHHLTYGNAIWGVNPCIKNNIFIWGPIGGLETIGTEFISHFSKKSQLIENARRAVVKMISFLPGYQYRCKNANLIICKTQSTYDHIPKKYRDKAVIFTDVAAQIDSEKLASQEKSNKIVFFSAGRLDGWRGFDLLIEAFSIAYKKRKDIELNILGAGKEKMQLKQLINKLKMSENIHLVGNVPMIEYEEYIRKTDVVLNACLKEGGVTTAFDCMKYGKPIICLDTGGYTRNFDSTCADIVPNGSRKQIIDTFAENILLMCDESRREKMGNAMHRRADIMDWDHKGEQITCIINKVIMPSKNTIDLPPVKGVSLFYRTVGKIAREILINPILRKELKNKNFSIICNNCNAGMIYHDFGISFMTPTINLYMFPEDYVKFCENLDYYLKQELIECESRYNFPMGKLDDVEICFDHAKNFHEAKKGWDRRKQRIQWDNIFLMFSEFRGCTYQLLQRFDALPYPKVVFTAFPYAEIRSAVYMPDYSKYQYVGFLGAVRNLKWQREYEQYFDIVKWLNKEQ